MEVVDVALFAVVRCLACGNVQPHPLPLKPAEHIRCGVCRRELPVGTETLNAVEVMKARYVAAFRDGSMRQTALGLLRQGMASSGGLDRDVD